MKFFNAQRRKLFDINTIKKYFLYAIGEIVLVVIGILIAVNINNLNEDKKSKKELQTILSIYKQDLVNDTILFNQRSIELDHKNKLFNIFMHDSVTISDYGKHPGGLGLIASYNPLEIQDKGITLLENYASANKTDSILATFIGRHRYLETLINNAQDHISEDIAENLYYYKNNEPWIADFLNNKFSNPDFHAYLLSDNHKSRLAIHKSLIINNLSTFVTMYKSYATNTLIELDKLLEVSH